MHDDVFTHDQVSGKLYGPLRHNVTCFTGIAEAHNSNGNGVREIHVYFYSPKLDAFLDIGIDRTSPTNYA